MSLRELTGTRRRVWQGCLAANGVALVAAVVFDYRPVVPLLVGAATWGGIAAGRHVWQAALWCAALGSLAFDASYLLAWRYETVASGGRWDAPAGPGEAAVWGDGARITLSQPVSFRPEDP